MKKNAPIVDEIEIIVPETSPEPIEPPSEAIEKLSRIGLTQITGGVYQAIGTVEVSDVAQWMLDNGFVKDGGCFRKPGMIANVL